MVVVNPNDNNNREFFYCMSFFFSFGCRRGTRNKKPDSACHGK